ncbi:hypothetical protein [Marinomonas profundimaris]|uniref:Outer membrane protein beta-barrel domain-containing protein n=1 Tax=Marinomonas profundimaris TaxID=1208321 RepID=W1RWR5_9GAMM|nr:hypothetical protein [Marinomonas profundimaris]ETI61417.1 hypothetical protein D104_05475 [Marinomonas profundimaris]
MIKLLFAFFLFLFGTAASAAPRLFDLELGPYLSSMDYTESGGISQTGSISGFNARYSAYYPFSVMLIDLSYAHSKLVTESAGKIKNVSNEVYDIRGMIGRALFLNDAYRITPYLGLGFRRSTADSRGKVSSSSVAGYKSQQTYIYNPIGIEIQELAGEKTWVVGGRFEYDSLLIADNETRLDASNSYKNVKVQGKKGYGYHFSLDFRHFLNASGGAIVIEPFYKYWHSSGNNSASLPSSTGSHSSNEWGLALMVSF